MRNVTIEDVNEIQTSLLQLHTLIDDRAPYTLAEDVVQNLQGHLQRTVGSTEEFATAGTTTNADTATTTTTDSTTADNATSTTTSTTPSEGTTTADTGMTDDTTTAPSSLMQ
jgi:Tfp pilus assembly major pilin PilA